MQKLTKSFSLIVELLIYIDITVYGYKITDIDVAAYWYHDKFLINFIYLAKINYV